MKWDVYKLTNDTVFDLTDVLYIIFGWQVEIPRVSDLFL